MAVERKEKREGGERERERERFSREGRGMAVGAAGAALWPAMVVVIRLDGRREVDESNKLVIPQADII